MCDYVKALQSGVVPGCAPSDVAEEAGGDE